MYKFWENLFNVSLIPIMILNIGAAIVGAIWLFVLGDWLLVVLGVLVGIILPWIYSIVMFITIPLTKLTLYLHGKRKKLLTLLIAWFNMLIGHVINIACVVGILAFAIIFSEDKNPIPFLLFGWLVAVGPFQYMARQEGPNAVGTYAAVYLVQISYILFSLGFLFGLGPIPIVAVILMHLLVEFFLLKTANNLFKEEFSVPREFYNETQL